VDAETTLAQRLGFAHDARVAVIHCDDIGMCHAANEGAFEALRAGPATCGSVMVPCPWFQEAARTVRDSPDLDIGVHLTLNAEWPHYRWGPVLGAARVPTLVDDEGYLPRTVPEVLRRAKPDEVEAELRAQIERALAAGIDVTHLDSHMGTVLMPPLSGVYAKLAVDYRLPVFAFHPTQQVLDDQGLGDALEFFATLMDELERSGIPMLDGFDANSLDFVTGEGLQHNLARLRALRTGVHYLICHPAKDGEELRAITGSAHARDFERRFYGGDAGRRALEHEGIQTVGMRAIRDWMRSRDGA
jgi:hypothetical protein